MARIGKHGWVISEWTPTFLTPDIIPWDIGFLDKEHCFPELNPILLHQSITTHLWYRKAQIAGYRIGFQICMTAAMILFHANDLMLYSNIQRNTPTLKQVNPLNAVTATTITFFHVDCGGHWYKLLPLISPPHLPPKIVLFPNSICWAQCGNFSTVITAVCSDSSAFSTQLAGQMFLWLHHP